VNEEVRQALVAAGLVETRDMIVPGFRLWWIPARPDTVYVEVRLHPDRFQYESTIRWGNELIGKCAEVLTEQGFKVVRQRRSAVDRLKVEKSQS